MGRKELKKEHEDNLKDYSFSGEIMQRISQKCYISMDNFDDIAKERMEITDKFGETHIIEGLRNDPAKGTTGVLDAFDKGTKYKGNPFLEVSRNMGSHLKAYCISKGLTDEELESMASMEPPEEVKEKIRGMKKDFLKMVYDMDLDKVADFYADLGEKIENDMDNFHDISTLTPDNLEKNTVTFLKYAGAQSFYNQTTDYKGSNETEGVRNMVEICNRKLTERGKQYNFEQLYLCSQLDFAVQTFHGNKFGSNEVTALNPATAQMGFGKLAAIHVMEEARGMVGTRNERLGKSVTDPNEFDGEYFGEIMSKRPDELGDVLKDGKLRDSKDIDGLKEEMESNVRTVLGRRRKNSPEYQAVLDSLSQISQLNKAPVKDDKAIEEQYKILTAATQKYLDGRNPATKSGEDRYKLVLRAKDICDGFALNSKMREAEAAYKEEKRKNPAMKEKTNSDILTKECGIEKHEEKLTSMVHESPTKTNEKGMVKN